MTDRKTVRPSSPWWRLWRDWLRPHWGMLALSLMMTGIVALASAGYSKLIQLVMTAFQSDTSGVVWWGPAGVIALSAANGIGQYFRETTSASVTTRMETELRKTMFERLVGTDLAKLQTEAPAGLAARFSSDITLIGTAVRALLGGITGTLTIIATFIVLLTIDWQLTIAICLIFGIALIPVNRIGRRLRRLAGHTQEEVATMTSEVT
ncbi:MAG TPA: ABC transporter transmembrane domain-containing protein, partial [Amaricoccus sp.]|nr:ABC transporter transmembrane domain-containing protein [Amaricoccus sp.]